MKAILVALVVLSAPISHAQTKCAYTLMAPLAYEQTTYVQVFPVDLDADGRLDLVVGTDEPPTVRFGVGPGKLTAPQPLPPYVIEIADVIGDPLPDLIALGNGTGGPFVEIYENVGHRQFRDRGALTNAERVHVADFTGDGRNDLLTIYHRTLAIYDRSGNRIGAAIELPDVPRDVDAGDLDGDGDIDVAVLNGEGTFVHVFHNHGNGVLTQQELLQPRTTRAIDLAVADLRRDGSADVLTLSPSMLFPRFAIETFPDAMNVPATMTADGRARQLLVRDLNADSAPDLVVAIDSDQPTLAQVAVAYVNDGTGALQEVDDTVSASVDGPLELGDYTGDGIPELILPTWTGFALVTGNGDGTFFRPRVIGRFSSTTFADIDGNGVDDYVYTGPDGFVRLAMADANGAFSTETIHYLHPSISLLSVGRGEVIVVENRSGISGQVFVHRRNAAGEWLLARRIELTNVGSVETRDLNGDGRNELILVERVIFDDPGSPPNPPPPIQTIKVIAGDSDAVLFQYLAGQQQRVSVTVGDATNEGIDDLLVVAGGGQILLFAGRGDGTFEQSAIAVATDIEPRDVVLGDFNGDQRTDIAFTSVDESRVRVVFASGTGFAQPQPLDAIAREVVAGDLNRDGITDLITTADRVATIWLGTPAGLLQRESYWLGSAGAPQLARERIGAPFSVVVSDGVIGATCGSNRRRRIDS